MNLPPLRSKTQTMKRLQSRTTTTTQIEGDTPRRASKQEPFNSRTTNAKKTGSWRTSSDKCTVSRYETGLMLLYTLAARTASLTQSETSPSRSTGRVTHRPLTHTKPQRLHHLCSKLGVHMSQPQPLRLQTQMQTPRSFDSDPPEVVISASRTHEAIRK